MKKFLLVITLCITYIVTLAQIPTIHPEKIQYEEFGEDLIFDTKANSIYLVIGQELYGERQKQTLLLGNTPQAAIKSLNNLREALKEPNSLFTLGEYRFFVESAGEAIVTSIQKNVFCPHIKSHELVSDIWAIINKFNLDYGNYQLRVYTIDCGGALYIDFLDYNLSEFFDLEPAYKGPCMKTYVTGQRGEILSEKKIKKIVSKIQKKQLHVSNSQLFLKVVTGNKK